MKVTLLFILLAGAVFGDVVHRVVPDGFSAGVSQEFYDLDPDRKTAGEIERSKSASFSRYGKTAGE